MTDAPAPELPDAVEIEVGGTTFTMYVHDDPSGLRGQVFRGEEKVAGSIQIYHHKDVGRLIEMARRDPAVQRAAARSAPA